MKEPDDVKDYIDWLHRHRREVLERFGGDLSKYFAYFHEVLEEHKKRQAQRDSDQAPGSVQNFSHFFQALERIHLKFVSKISSRSSSSGVETLGNSESFQSPLINAERFLWAAFQHRLINRRLLSQSPARQAGTCSGNADCPTSSRQCDASAQPQASTRSGRPENTPQHESDDVSHG